MSTLEVDTRYKRQMMGMKGFLTNIKPKDAGVNFGNRDFADWHGSKKSQSNAFRGQLTFQIKSMINTAGKYVTAITEKGKKRQFVTYESPTLDDAKTIIDKIVQALTEKGIE